MTKNLAASLICVIVALAPLPFGSAEPFWGAFWCALLAPALVMTTPVTGGLKLNAPVLVLLSVVALWCGVVVIQYLPISAGSVGPGWDEAGRILGQHALVPRRAAYGQVPLAAVVPPLALVLALAAGFVFGRDPVFVTRVYGWVALAGLCYVVYAIFAELTHPSMLLWREKTAYLDSVTGTFVNHNTAAIYFGSVAIIWYLRALRRFRQRFDLARCFDVHYMAGKLRDAPRDLIGYVLVFLVILATVFMTRSRAGSLLTVAVLGFVTVLYLMRQGKIGSRTLLGGVFFIAVGALVLVVAGGQFSNELATRGVYDAGRADAWRSAAAIISDHPWLGTGLGTFAGVFPGYRNPAGGVWGVFDHAHSTPIELMVEMGVPFALLVFGLWILMLVIIVRAAMDRPRNGLYLAAGAGIGLLGTLHSLIDFSLQIPGYSIICGVLVGASLATALAPPEAEPVRRKARPRGQNGGQNDPQNEQNDKASAAQELKA